MVDYSKLVPVTIAGIKGLDTKITDIENLNPESTFVTKLKEWLASATNGIDSLFAKKIKTNELCVGEVCVTESQFLQILNNSNANQNTNSTEGSQSTEEVVPVVEDTPDPTPTEENVTPEEPVVEPETVPVVEEEQAVQVDVPNGLIIE
jgi:hypothetical protein